MKKIVIYIMFINGAALVILAGFFAFFKIETIFTETIFQIFGANTVIIAGLHLLKKLEIQYLILEYLIDICYIIAVLVTFGLIFDWYSSIPVWVLVVMAIAIYMLAIILSITKINKETKEINELLQKRKEKQD
ncbi:MAG: hypothetical protein FWD40_09230 [Treponema sp.]|nr:hypothetical protein [Treponema sp.]